MKKFNTKLSRIISLCLVVCIIVSTISINKGILSYGGDEASVTVDMPKIVRVLTATDGEGKTCDISSLPEELQTELEGSIIVQNGKVKGLKYYIIAESMGSLSKEDILESLQALSIIFVNQDNKKTADIPTIKFVENELCTFSIPDSPEQIWEGTDNDDEDETAKEDTETTVRATSSEGLKATSSEAVKKKTSLFKIPVLDDEENINVINTARNNVMKSVLATKSEAQKDETESDKPGGGYFPNTATPSTATPSTAASGTAESDNAANIATPGTATPSTATKSEADKTKAEKAGEWELSPMSAKRVLLMPTPRTVSADMDFLTKVTVTTMDDQSASDTPVDIKKMLKLSYEYKIPDAGGIASGTKYTFHMPEQLLFNNLEFKIYYDNIVIGDGYADTDKNEFWICFNSEADSHKLLAPGTEGDFWITASVNEGKIGNGGLIPLTFSAGSFSQDAYVYFPLQKIDAEVTLAKSSVLDAANNKIRWTVVVTPKMENAKDEDKVLKSLVINDEITTDGLVLCDPLNLKVSIKGGLDIKGIYKADTNKSFTYEFPENTDATEQYEISYDTEFSLSVWNGGTKDKITFENTVNRDFSYLDYKIDDAKKAVKDTAATAVTGNDKTLKKASQEVVGGFISKSGVKSADEDKITWTLELNENKYSMTGVKVTDTITLDTNAEPGGPIAFSNLKVKIGDAAEEPATGITYTNDGNKKSSFILDLGNISTPVTITYDTSIDENIRKSNEITQFNNEVLLETTQFHIKGKSPAMKVENRFLDKKGVYDRKNHVITWTLDVNKARLPLNGASVTDTIPDDQTVFGTPESSKGGTVDVNGQEVKITYPYDFSDNDTVTIKTTVKDPDIWAGNISETGVAFANKAEITATGGMANGSYEKTASCVIKSNVLQKSGTGYDPGTKQAEWQLKVNENVMTMTNAVITDVVEPSQKFADGGSIDASFTGDTDKIASYTYDSQTRVLTINLLTPLTSQAVIKYKTELTDLSILESNGKVELENSASIKSDEMTGTAKAATAAAKQEISKSVLVKEGTPNNSKGTITWKIKINANRVELINPVISDSIPENLALVTESVKLYKVDVSGNEIPEPLTSDNVSYANKKFTFSFLKTITDEYRLEFDTYFDVDGEYANSAELAANNGTIKLTGTSEKVAAQYAAGGGGTRPTAIGHIKVIKKDESGNPLEGAEFSLTKKDAEIGEEAITDENGIAEWTGLRAGEYTIEEKKAPDGYYFEAADSKKTVTIKNNDATVSEHTFVNKKKNGITVNKLDEENGNDVAGAEIKLYNKDNTSESYTKVTGKNGEAFFEGLRQGTYIAKETKAPAGYILNPTEYEVVLNSSSASVSVDILNTPVKGSLEIVKKARGSDTLLSGAEIALYTENGVLIESKTTGDDGKAVFDDLRYGKYYYNELTAPEGYQLDADMKPLEFYITNGGIKTVVFENDIVRAGTGGGGGGGGGGGTGSFTYDSNKSTAVQNTPPDITQGVTPAPGAVSVPDAAVQQHSAPPQGVDMNAISNDLPQGSYSLFTLDENGLVLGEYGFDILHSKDADKYNGGGRLYGVPKVGDKRAPVFVYLMLIGLSIAGLIFINRKKREFLQYEE